MAFNTKLNLIDAKIEQISGSTLTLSGNTVIADSGTFNYGTNPTITESTQIVNKQYVDDEITGATSGKLDITDFDIYTGDTDTRFDTIEGQYITGVTNGLTKVGSHDAKLGGTNALNESTSILGGSQNLFLGTSGSKLNEFSINAAGNLVMSLSGGTITTSDGRGLRYSTSGYTTTFVDDSLVTKLYVDTVVSGLDPKSSVLVATTGDTTLSGLTTIDGVTLTANNRVLVKNQTTATENGIYVAGTGAWTRSSDFDDSPDGEVSEGALIPVLSGSTNINSTWILITKDPITLGTTELEFTKFSQLIDIAGGLGIDISTVGQQQTINVDLAANSGLNTTSGLSVDSSIAGSGLTWNAGVINANVSAVAIGGTAIDVKLDSGDLAIDSNDIQAAISGNTFENGLTDTSGTVKLGGTLSETTIIAGNSQVFSLTGLTDLNLGATTVNLKGEITIEDEPSEGSLPEDQILVRNTGDTKVKYISSVELSDIPQTNVIVVITGNTTLTNEYDTVLVSGSTGVEVKLPLSSSLSASDDGRLYKIKDVSGNALTNPIDIKPNGSTIDGSTDDAQINTDYGAIELTYSNELDGWFINNTNN